MHPIERLRWIARADDEAIAALAAEAAWTLSELALDEPAAVVTACRRLVESHLSLGPLWWVAASMLVASDPDETAHQAVDELLSDPTADRLAEALCDRLEEGAIVVVACPAETVLEAVPQLTCAFVRLVGTPMRSKSRSSQETFGFANQFELGEADEAVEDASVVLVEALAAGSGGVIVPAGTGALADAAMRASVPLWAVVGAGRMLHAQLLAEMLRRGDGAFELIGPGAIEAVVGPSGLGTATEGLGRQSCPAAPELLVRAG